MKQQRAVIIIPTYNEKENIAQLIPILEDVFSRVKNWEMHVLVVDDSSPDGTADVVRSLIKKHKNVHLLVNPKKAGLGAAYLSGMKEAFHTLGADVIFEFDADLSHNPEKIPEFLEKLDQGADFVLGSRYIRGGSIPSDWGLYRKFLSVVGNIVIMIVLTDFRIHDWTSGYRAIRKSVYESVGTEMSDPQFSGYTFQVGFLHKAVRRGFKVAEVPFRFVDRKIGKSKLGSEYIKNTLLYILMVRYHEITSSHIFKFAVVGFIGFIISVTGSFLFATFPFVRSFSQWLMDTTKIVIFNPSFVATAMATECAIISNFILNNFFTFSDRKVVTSKNIIPKFLQFNTGSLGAVVISSLVVGIGTSLTGEEPISKFIWLVIATAISMFVNYFIYSRIIWKKK